MLGKTVMNDANDDGELGSVFNTIVDGGVPYYSNMIAHPQLGIDADDNLYLSYSSLVDGHYVPPVVEFESSDDSGANTGVFTQEFPENSNIFSDVFMLKSTDKGTTWDGPLNVTNAADSEEAYPTIARTIKDTIFLAYQHDAMPGVSLNNAPQILATINEIAVAKILPEDINDDVAPKDSEPHLTVFSTGYILPQNCSLDKDMFLKANAWGLDYPEGLLTEIKLEGLADYSTIGTYTEAIYVEDSAGNKSDTIQVSVEIVADEHAPVIEIDGACTEFAVLAGSTWENPEVRIIDLAEFSGEVTDSGCDVSENLQIEDNVDTEEVGTYTVKYTVTDFADNEGILELTVEVIAEDTQGPEVDVTGLPDIIGLFDPFNPADVRVNARDNVDCENVEVNIEGLDEINSEELGDYPVTITVTDQSGNETVVDRVVTVGDNTAPSIILNGAYTIAVGPDDCGGDVVFDMNDDPWVYAVDETDGDLTDQVTADYGGGIDCSTDGVHIITYTVSDASGNEALAERSVRVQTVGIEDNPIYEFVDIYPNPTKGLLNVETTGLQVSEITVYNLVGKTILSLSNKDILPVSKIDLSDQPEGVYMVNVITNEGTITRKVNVAKN